MDEENKVSINGKEYDYVEMDDQCQYFVDQARNLKARIAEARFNLDQLVAAEGSFINALVNAVEKEETTTETE